jgi:hypothetical protein
MSDELLNKIIQELLSAETIDIDDIVFFNGGAYVLPQRPGQPVFDIRAILNYAKDKGINPSQLTDKELETFVTNWDELAEPYKNGTLKISESLPYDYDDFYKKYGIPDKRSPEEILELIKGYIAHAEENLITAEQALPAQLEAIKADKED